MAIKPIHYPRNELQDAHVWARIFKGPKNKDDYFLRVQDDKPFMQKALETVMKNLSEHSGHKYEVIRTS